MKQTNKQTNSKLIHLCSPTRDFSLLRIHQHRITIRIMHHSQQFMIRNQPLLHQFSISTRKTVPISVISNTIQIFSLPLILPFFAYMWTLTPCDKLHLLVLCMQRKHQTSLHRHHERAVQSRHYQNPFRVLHQSLRTYHLNFRKTRRSSSRLQRSHAAARSQIPQFHTAIARSAQNVLLIRCEGDMIDVTAMSTQHFQRFPALQSMYAAIHPFLAALPHRPVVRGRTDLLRAGVEAETRHTGLVNLAKSTQQTARRHTPHFDRSFQISRRQKLAIAAERQAQHALRVGHQFLLPFTAGKTKTCFW